MKNLTLVFAIMLIAFSVANAQNGQWKHQLAFDLQYVSPSGDLAEKILEADPGFGISATYYYQLEETPNLFLSGSGAYHSLNTFFGTMSNIFISGGAKYNFSLNQVQPYLGAELGLTFIGKPEKYTPNIESTFGLILKGGVRYPITPTVDLDANLKYLKFLGDTKLSLFSVSVGAAFPI